MRYKGQAFCHLICIAWHPLCSHLYTPLSPFISVLLILIPALPCIILTHCPRGPGVGGRAALLLVRDSGVLCQFPPHLGRLGVEAVEDLRVQLPPLG